MLFLSDYKEYNKRSGFCPRFVPWCVSLFGSCKSCLRVHDNQCDYYFLDLDNPMFNPCILCTHSNCSRHVKWRRF